MKIIPFQQELRPALPVISGNKDYDELKSTLIRIDEILIESGLDKIVMLEGIRIAQARLEGKNINAGYYQLSDKQKIDAQKSARTGMRVIISKRYLTCSFRGFARRLADSPLIQWFVMIDKIDAVSVPSKSTIERYEKMFSTDFINMINSELLKRVGEGGLNIDRDINFEDCYFDLTCLSANIHYPVDWVLLKDAICSLIGATLEIRKYGIKNRMEDPKSFISKINGLCIAMSQAKYKKDAKKKRKAILRLMKKLVTKVENHGKKHMELLEKMWKDAGLSEKTKDFIVKRLQNILEQLPEAKRQAHERIIGERKVKNKDKILSLYEPDIFVIVRKKDGARVEFGNSLILTEQEDGLIIDWRLYKNEVPHDAKACLESLIRIEDKYDSPVKSATGDRGCNSKDMRKYLDNKEIENNICPRNVKKLEEKLQDDNFCMHQKRRASTEARISILKNVFLDITLKSKEFTNRERSVAFAVLAHNLWKLARMPVVDEKIRKIPA